MSARIIVVPPSSEIGEIARETAPAGFELVLARNDRAADRGRARQRGVHDLLSPRDDEATTFYRAAPRLKLVQLLSAGYDDVDLDAARRARVPVSNNGGANAISVAEHTHDADARGVAPGDLAARQRVGRPLARQRPGAPDVRAQRQDPGYRRPRHHRQEGGAARPRVRHAGRILRHRAAERGRRGPARRALPAVARVAQEHPTSCRCTCRSTIRRAE